MSSSEWKYIDAISYCTKVVDGTHDSPKRANFGKSLITSKHIKGRSIDFGNAYLISNDDFHKINLRSKVDQWDVLISMIGEYCGYCYVEREPIIDYAVKNVGVFKVGSQIKSEWLYYYLNSPEGLSSLASLKSGTSQPYLSLGALRTLPILIPGSEKEMEKIVSILSALDEKIELNRQTNASLEAITQSIFKEWFVDFKFPGATGEMIESDLGPIPKGWSVKPLPEVIAVNPSRPLRTGSIAPYLDMANMPTQGHRGIEWIDRPFGSGTRFINGDTLLARITPCLENGKTAFVDFLAEGQTGWGSTEYIILCPKPPLPHEYGYYLARFDDLRNHAIQNMIGTSGRQRTPASSMDSFLTVVPPKAIAGEFGKIAQANMAQIRALDEESRTLAALRDNLLPKLMSGKIKIL